MFYLKTFSFFYCKLSHNLFISSLYPIVSYFVLILIANLMQCIKYANYSLERNKSTSDKQSAWIVGVGAKVQNNFICAIREGKKMVFS